MKNSSHVKFELFFCYNLFMINSSDKKWFKRKKYGWGWTPITWQGWLAVVLYIVLLVVFSRTLDENTTNREAMLTFILPVILLTIALIRVCYRKGEKPRWQWGEDLDDSSQK